MGGTDMDLVTFAKDYGLFAALFTFLLVYVLQENARREKKYVEIIEKFANIIECKLETLEKAICDFIKKS
jgi:hypothetical protein